MNIVFKPDNKIVHAVPDESILAASVRAGVLIDGSCDGTGKCGKCKVKLISGELSELTEAEKGLLTPAELEAGYRLACMTRAEGDVEIEIPGIHGGSDRKKAMTNLPEFFMKEWKTDPAARAHGARYGVAFDVGTTTVVGMLWDLENGNLIATGAETNYQSAHGADVISRIQYTIGNSDGVDGLTWMHKAVIDCCNHILEGLCQGCGVTPDEIGRATVVGNTTMSHLFLGVNPASLSRYPFDPMFLEPPVKSAGELGLNISANTDVLLLPNIAGHVGSDITGVMLAIQDRVQTGAHVAIDIGTNGEVVAYKDGKSLCCSTAAGPAFEGATIRHGMRAAAGAIEKVEITGNGADTDIQVKTINDAPAIGICGSGLIDAIAVVLELGVVNEMGKMLTPSQAVESKLPGNLAKRLRGEGTTLEFVLASDGDREITLTQADVREVQLAKGAILAGIQTLLMILDIEEEELDSVLLAGAFGNYINKNSALRIGLLPNVEVDKVTAVGNGAGAGASMALLSTKEYGHGFELAAATEHVELSRNEDFQEFYIMAMTFCS